MHRASLIAQYREVSTHPAPQVMRDAVADAAVKTLHCAWCGVVKLVKSVFVVVVLFL